MVTTRSITRLHCRTASNRRLADNERCSPKVSARTMTSNTTLCLAAASGETPHTAPLLSNTPSHWCTRDTHRTGLFSQHTSWTNQTLEIAHNNQTGQITHSHSIETQGIPSLPASPITNGVSKNPHTQGSRFIRKHEFSSIA